MAGPSRAHWPSNGSRTGSVVVELFGLVIVLGPMVHIADVGLPGNAAKVAGYR
jgi:hypothetical protein